MTTKMPSRTTSHTINPIVNINGDSIVTLFNQQQAIREAWEALMQALREAHPHGRNFQCNPKGDYEAAVVEMNRRMQLLCDLRVAFDDDIKHLFDQERK